MNLRTRTQTSIPTCKTDWKIDFGRNENVKNVDISAITIGLILFAQAASEYFYPVRTSSIDLYL